jgi:hypothetical protein
LYSCSKFSGLGRSPSGRTAVAGISSEVPAASETNVFFWTEAMRKKPQDIQGRGDRTRRCGRMPVTKSYVRCKLLSTENATELPKCSKSLHFRAHLASRPRFYGSEEKQKITTVNGRFFVRFAVRVAGTKVFRRGLLGSLPEIWPIRCS